LDVNLESFDAMLEGSVAKKAPQDGPNTCDPDSGNAKPQEEDKFAEEQTSQLRTLARKVEDFVEGNGDLEGAVFSEWVVV
jgi:paraquat-inducible protein B